MLTTGRAFVVDMISQPLKWIMGIFLFRDIALLHVFVFHKLIFFETLETFGVCDVLKQEC